VTSAQRHRSEQRLRELIRVLADRGLSQRAIAAELRISTWKVRRWMHAGPRQERRLEKAA
jgi:DNA-binding transcriptional regulator LsrR (DeoR family)